MKIETKFNIGDIVRSKANHAMYGRIGGIYIYSDDIKYNFYTVNHGYMYLYENEIELIPKQILDDKEKKYLSAVIKPFRNKIRDIIKYNRSNAVEYICINFDDLKFIAFPSFKPNTMYKGMEVNKEYTLDELEL